MKEQEIYKGILLNMKLQSENLQINNTEEFIQKLISELNYYELPKLKPNNELT